MARRPLLSFQPSSKLHLRLPGARTSSQPGGRHKSFSEVFSATSFTGENDRKGLSIPSLSGRPMWPVSAAGSRPINYSVWTELFESTEVLTSIFIDPCLLTVSQRDRASFLRISDIGSSTWSQKMWVQALNQEDLLEEGMATHPSTLAWETPWREEAWWAKVHRVAESDMTEHAHRHLASYDRRKCA